MVTVTHWLEYWHLVPGAHSGASWEGLGSEVFLKEVLHWGELWEFYSLVQLHCLCFLVRVEDAVSHLPTAAACALMDSNPVGCDPNPTLLCAAFAGISPQLQEGSQHSSGFCFGVRSVTTALQAWLLLLLLFVCVCLSFALAREKKVFFSFFFF